MLDVTYNKDELVGISDEELINALAKAWEDEDKTFEVCGELPALGDSTFGFLQNVHLIKNGKLLYYPLKGENRTSARFFVNPKDAAACGSKNKTCWIRCKLELSPTSERAKHNNPLLSCVKEGTAESLRELPENIPIEVITSDNSQGNVNQLISSSIYNFYYEKANAEFSELIEQKKRQQEEILAKEEAAVRKELEVQNHALEKAVVNRKTAIEVGKRLYERQVKLAEKVEHLEKEEQEKHKAIQDLNQYYLKIEADMNRKMERLKNYVEDKALFLKTFEFIEEEDLNIFLSTPRKEERFEGISFLEDLKGDYRQAVSYIQSYLVNNDILYPRHIIENFITLLRTKDLIVLAGDSGSGKTNLVKSFAKAVGGKSIIIPVKPNWTSSEDLLGYYNPLEKKYLATPFLEALLEAHYNPETPYFICLDEMNLARVEYYFADFLSLLESRDEEPKITLYSEDESSHVLSELKAVVDIIQSTKMKYSKDGVVSFIELLKDEQLNSQLRAAFGFGEQDSLIKYHNEIRRMLSAVMELPASIKMPANVHLVGAINIDETTHYLSPKILDRAHIMRFESPLLNDWDAILEEVDNYDFEDISKPLTFEIEALGYRKEYPKYDRENSFCQLFVELNREFFHKLGVEFGMRTIRQGLSYLKYFQEVNNDQELAINNFLLHKVLPKMTFDGNKYVGEHTKLELVDRIFIERIKQQLTDYDDYDPVFSAVQALENLVSNAKANDGIVNFWAK